MYLKLEDKENKVFLMKDIWKGIWDGANPDEQYMSDEVHPNDKGYEIMAKNYFNFLKPLFEHNNLIK